jgi:hypothetical protein
VAIRGFWGDMIKDVHVAGCYRHMPPLQSTYFNARKRFSGHYVDKFKACSHSNLLFSAPPLKQRITEASGGKQYFEITAVPGHSGSDFFYIRI